MSVEPTEIVIQQVIKRFFIPGIGFRFPEKFTEHRCLENRHQNLHREIKIAQNFPRFFSFFSKQCITYIKI